MCLRNNSPIMKRVSIPGRPFHPSKAYVYGYSIGLVFPPTWSEDIYFIREGIELELKPGMTFHSPVTVRILGRAYV